MNPIASDSGQGTADSRLTTVLRLLSAVCCLLSLSAPAQVTEKISVERVIVDARVTDDHGEPITDLEAKDFRVKIDGKPVKVESAEWVPETAAARGLASIGRTQQENPNPDQQPAPAGRLLIFFIQTDFARNKARLGGQMKVISNADELVDSLEPEDKVA